MKPVEFLRKCESIEPAVVVGGDGVALGTIRDLGRERVPVLAMGPDTSEPALHSRYCAPWLCADPHYHEERLIEDLETVGSVLPRRAVVIPTHDDFVFALSRHKTRLERHFRIPVLPWERMCSLADKELQLQLAWRAGIETPITVFIHGPDELAVAADSVPFPAVLKPAVPLSLVRRTGFKAVVVHNRDSLEEAYLRYSFCGSLLLQELVPGGDEEIYVAGTYHDAHARALAVFTGRKLRQHPRGFGVTRLGESLWWPDLADLTLRLLAEVRYEGVSDVEFKRDPRDGSLKLMEINARPGFWTPLATASGVNLSYVAYRDAVGRPISGTRQRDGVVWSDILRDSRDSLGELRQRELGWREWLAPLAGIRADAYLSFRDPYPGLSEMASLGVRGLRRVLPGHGRTCV
jgi:D-aspartate ligase